MTVISADGFLEAHDEGFYDHIKRAIQRGLEVFYLIPQTNAAFRSFDDYNKTLRKKFKKDLSASEQKRVHCYHLDPDAELIGLSSRIIVFGKKSNTSIISEQIYVYVSSGHQYWIEYHEDKRHSFLTKLENAIDPVPFNPPDVDDADWRLPSLIKNQYQIGFTGREKGYGRVREMLGTASSAEEVTRLALLHFVDCEFAWEHRALRWLDIGCEDGANTEIIYDDLSSNNERQISLTAIDSSAHQKPNDVLQRSVYWRGLNGIFERYVENHPPSEKYDLITLLHSAYVIDPLYIVEAYRRLTDDGILILVSSPYRAGPTPSGETTSGNFINSICGVADGLLGRPRTGRSAQTAYEFKTITGDPWRNYGEDWVAAFDKLFGAEGTCWRFALRKNEVKTCKIFGENNLTDDGALVAEFFAHGRIDDQEAYLRAAYDALMPLSESGKLPADEYFLCVSKRELKDNHPNPPRFKPKAGVTISPDKGVSAQGVTRPSKPLIVFVSTGGTCRDPMAAAIFEQWCGEDVTVQAASLMDDQRPISREAKTVVQRKLGKDISGHLSQHLDSTLCAQASLIIVMEELHLDEVERDPNRNPYFGKFKLMTDFGQIGLEYTDISNPWLKSKSSTLDAMARYEQSYQDIYRALDLGRNAIIDAAKVAHQAP